MKITRQDVEHLALSSRLELSCKEKEEYLEELNRILDALEVLNQVDTSNVEPLLHVLPLKNVFREDEYQVTLPKEKALQNAPDQEEGMFKVPRII